MFQAFAKDGSFFILIQRRATTCAISTLQSYTDKVRIFEPHPVAYGESLRWASRNVFVCLELSGWKKEPQKRAKISCKQKIIFYYITLLYFLSVCGFASPCTMCIYLPLTWHIKKINCLQHFYLCYVVEVGNAQIYRRK